MQSASWEPPAEMSGHAYRTLASCAFNIHQSLIYEGICCAAASGLLGQSNAPWQHLRDDESSQPSKHVHADTKMDIM